MPFDLGFLSLYRLFDSCHQIMASLGRAPWAHTNSDWDELFIQIHQEKNPHNFVVLSFSV